MIAKSVAQWLSAWLEIEGLQVLACPHWRHCVASLSNTIHLLLSTGSTRVGVIKTVIKFSKVQDRGNFEIYANQTYVIAFYRAVAISFFLINDCQLSFREGQVWSNSINTDLSWANKVNPYHNAPRGAKGIVWSDYCIFSLCQYCLPKCRTHLHWWGANKQ